MKLIVRLACILVLAISAQVARAQNPVYVTVLPHPVVNLTEMTSPNGVQLGSNLTLINTTSDAVTISILVATGGKVVSIPSRGRLISGALHLKPGESVTVADFRTVWQVTSATDWLGILGCKDGADCGWGAVIFP